MSLFLAVLWDLVAWRSCEALSCYVEGAPSRPVSSATMSHVRCPMLCLSSLGRGPAIHMRYKRGTVAWHQTSLLLFAPYPPSSSSHALTLSLTLQEKNNNKKVKGQSRPEMLQARHPPKRSSREKKAKRVELLILSDEGTLYGRMRKYASKEREREEGQSEDRREETKET